MKKLTALIVIFWLTLIVSFYYVSHDPINPVFLLNIILIFWQIILGILILLFCIALGSLLFPDKETKSFSLLAILLVIGIGVTAPILYLLGSVFGVSKLLAWIFLALGLLILRKQVKISYLIFKTAWQDIKRGGRLIQIIIWILGFYIFFELFIAISPPIHFDTLVYHFTIPQQYLAEAQISYLPNNIYWGFPQTIQMLYLWFLALGGQQAAIISYLMGLIAILGLWSITERLLGSRYAWVAIACLLSGYSLVTALGTGYLAWSSILVGVAFLSLIILWRQNSFSKAEFFLGIIAGAAFGIKYTNGYLFLIGILILIFYKSKKLWHYIFGAALIALPWLLKNYLATGNPIYPLIFPTSDMSIFRLSMFQFGQLRGNWTDLIFLPIRATLWGIDNAELGDAPGYLSSIGPLILGFSVFAFLGWRTREEKLRHALQISVWISVLGIITWAIAGRLGFHLNQTRLYYSIFPALAILAAVGFSEIEKIKVGDVRLGRVAAVFLIIVSLLNLSQIGLTVFKRGAAQRAMGLVSTDTYLQNNLGMLAVVNQAMVDLPEDSKVLILWEPREYYCAPVCEADEILDRWKLDYEKYGDISLIKNSWREAGYSHLVVYNSGLNFLRQNEKNISSSEWLVLEELFGSLPLTEDFGGSYTLYNLSP